MIRNSLTSLFLSFIIGSPSIPDPTRAALEALSARWFRGVWISGIVVAFGCMLEAWEVTIDVINWRRARKKPPLKSLFDNPGSWRYPLAALGLFLVVGGIVCETVFEVLDSNVESQLRAYESDKITAAEGKAADAIRDSGSAKQSSIGAATSADKAKISAVMANRNARDAENKAGEIDRTLDSETEKRRELERSLDRRSLNLVIAERTNFEELKEFAGTNVIFEVLTDSEARRAADELENLVHLAGWNIVAVKSNPELYTGMFDGVSIVGGNWRPLGIGVDPVQRQKDWRAKEAADALALWLNEHDWDAKPRSDPNAQQIPNNTIKIYVGFKPSPYFDPKWVKDLRERAIEALRQEREYEKLMDERRRTR